MVARGEGNEDFTCHQHEVAGLTIANAPFHRQSYVKFHCLIVTTVDIEMKRIIMSTFIPSKVDLLQ